MVIELSTQSFGSLENHSLIQSAKLCRALTLGVDVSEEGLRGENPDPHQLPTAKGVRCALSASSLVRILKWIVHFTTERRRDIQPVVRLKRRVLKPKLLCAAYRRTSCKHENISARLYWLFYASLFSRKREISDQKLTAFHLFDFLPNWVWEVFE